MYPKSYSAILKPSIKKQFITYLFITNLEHCLVIDFLFFTSCFSHLSRFTMLFVAAYKRGRLMLTNMHPDEG